ncbi:hypothetical protein [Azonexus sp.]|uniref:hypothetical protein n=1 Tax=Azonexus sp. TaxID=1872668 RepID=UPI0027B97CBE|nr:hypothetical protein [Azonexus sp.]
MRLITRTLAKGFGLGLLAAGVSVFPAFSAELVLSPVAGESNTMAPADRVVRRVNFEQESASPDARHVADWIVHANDNRQLPFVIVDKTQGKVFVFYADGRLRGAAPALLGLAVGDDAVPGIGERKLSSIRPEERTTPAGRFEASLDRNLKGGEILWVDYETAISLHPVATGNPRERRAERLATPSPGDNRISFGCINVPAAFFKNVVSAAFQGTNGIVYVLPETRSPQQVFASYELAAPAALLASNRDLPSSAPATVSGNGPSNTRLAER